MTKHRQLVYGAQIPQDWLDSVQEFISTLLTPNAVVTILNATTVQVPAGSDNLQIGVGINGRWRYNSASVNATHPGGAAGTYNLWACGSDNVFVIGPPESDSTVYGFTLQILPVASTPGTALSRIIGSVVWSGAAITDAYLINQEPADAIAAVASLRTLGAGAQQAAAGTAPAAAVAAIPADGAVGVPSLRTIGTGALQASPGTEAAARTAAIAAIPADGTAGTASLRTIGTGAQQAAGGSTVTTTGVFASRPSIGSVPAGRIYFATDTGVAYISDGSAWQRVDLDELNRIAVLEARVPTSPSALRVEGSGSSVASTATALLWLTTVHALQGLSALVAGSTFTIPVGMGGLYDYNLVVQFANPSASTTANGGAGIRRGGSTYIDSWNGKIDANNGGLQTGVCVSGQHLFSAGDVIDTPAFCVTPGTLQWGGSFSMKLNRV